MLDALSLSSSVSLRQKKAVILDLDGCVYLGESPIAGATETIERIRKAGKRVLFLTNNATKKPLEYVRKLKKMGIDSAENDILTSGSATAIYLRKQAGSTTVLPIGEQALSSELAKAGHKVLKLQQWKKAAYVVVALDFGFNYEKMKAASNAIMNGSKFIATNIDPTLPTEDGFVPGAGAVVSSIETSTGIKPTVIGKPSRIIVDMALALLTVRPSEAIMVGDRIDTDIVAGNAVGTRTILVLTGATSQADLRRRLSKRERPSLVLQSLSSLIDYL